jgi:cytochrome c
MRHACAGVAVVVALAGAAVQARAGGDAAAGQRLYEQRCTACHSPDANRIGPMHRGVFGRKAGSVPGFEYSAAVKGSGLVWNERTLDAWLTDPQRLVPGQAMFFSVAEAKDRADIIAYLATLKP